MTTTPTNASANPVAFCAASGSDTAGGSGVSSAPSERSGRAAFAAHGSHAAWHMTEDEAREYVLSHCWPAGERFCPRCGVARLYTLNKGRFRCAGCKYTFQDLSGRWINNGNLSALTWLRLADCFVRERTVHELCSEVGLSYNAAYKAVTAMRFAIMAHAVDAQQMFGPETGLGQYLNNKKLTGIPDAGKNTTMGGSGVSGGAGANMAGSNVAGGNYQGATAASSMIPVFGIMERNGWVFVDLISGMSAETVFHFNHSFHLAALRSGSIVYTQRYRHYEALVFCGDDSLPMEYLRRYEGVSDIERGPFWSFAGPRLKRFKGISPQRFPLYIKELEFRFNNRSGDLFTTLVRYICDLVPDFSS